MERVDLRADGVEGIGRQSNKARGSEFAAVRDGTQSRGSPVKGERGPVIVIVRVLPCLPLIVIVLPLVAVVWPSNFASSTSTLVAGWAMVDVSVSSTF